MRRMLYCSYTNERGDVLESKCVLSMINEISSLSNEWIEKEIKALNIPVLLNHIPLFFILEKDEAMEFRYLRDKWKISKSSLSDILHKYEDLGYVEKDATCEDKRCVMIRLTPKGFDLKKEFLKIEADILNIMVSGYTEEEREKLEKDIVNILNNMKKVK